MEPTKEEIEQYLLLKEKIQKFELYMMEKENEYNQGLLTNPAYSGIIPHQLNITLITDVNRIESNLHMSPVLIEKFSRTYVIDFLDKSYLPLVDAIYEQMQKVLEDSCKNIYNNATETK